MSAVLTPGPGGRPTGRDAEPTITGAEAGSERTATVPRPQPSAEPVAPVTPGAALLHNMSARPRTEVAFEVPPVDAGGVARFRLPESVTIAAATAEHPEAVLDGAWAGYGLNGAALVFPWHARHAVVYERAVSATDRVLVLNVLARARTSVLLGGAPAVLDPQYLGRDLASDDPRLVALVEATGARKVSRR